MRNLFKKSLTLCLVAILAFSCFAGIVSAETAYTATIAVQDQTITKGTTSVDVTLNITSTDMGINEALIEVSSPLGTIATEATLVSYTTANKELASIKYPEGSTNFGSFYLSVADDLSTSPSTMGSLSAAEIKVTFTVAETKEPGSYPINIKVDGVRAASGNEDVISFLYNVTDDISSPACVVVQESAVEPETPIEVQLIASNTVKGVLPVNTIDEALELATYYVSNKYEGSWVDPTIALNDDLVLTSDIYISKYTTLDLGDHAVTGDYDICFANNGIVKANYELTEIAANPLIKATVEDGVYTYTSKLALEIASRNLNLGDKINIIFKGKATEDGTADITYSLKYYQNDGDNNYIIIDEAELNTLSNTTRNVEFLTEGIVAQKMGVLTYGTICAKTTVDGVDYYVYSETREYSVRDYANNTYNKESTGDTLKKLLATMLNYGASAQLTFDFNTDDLVNNVDYLTEADKQLPDIDWSTDEQYLLTAKEVNNLKDYTDNLSIAYRKSCSLELTDGADIKFTIKNVSSEHTYKLAVWSYNEYNALLEQVNGDLDELEKVLTLDNCNKIVDFGPAFTTEGEVRATASFAGIPVKKFSDTYVFRPVEIAADGSCAYDYLFAYSVTQYSTNIIGNSSASKYHDICKRIAVYADAARAFYDNGYIVDSEG